MGLISISNCPICNSTDFNVHLTCTDYTASYESFTLKKCKECQFLLTSPRPDDTSISKYYLSEKYISHTGGNQSLTDKIYLLARKLTLGWKRKFVNKYSNKKDILDVGCGTGEFLSEMKSHGWNITGIEPSPQARKSSEKKTGTKIYESLSEIQGSKFSTITLWHVLEHLPNLNQAFQQLKSLLDESGTIFIAVPNLNSFDANYYQSFWAAYDVPRHLWHFNKTNMKILLEKNGLKLVNILPMRLDSFYVSLLSESFKHPKRQKFLHFCMAMLIGLKSNLLARKNFEYSSLIYVVTR